MSENVKMSVEEVNEVRAVQESFQNKIYQFGQLYLQKIQAENAVKFAIDQESKLTDDWTQIQKRENDLVDKLLAKYGEGSLDLSAGTFISEKKPVV